MAKSDKSKETRNRALMLAQFSLLVAIEAVFCFVPFLGSIPMPFGLAATLAMIPVIITAMTMGTAAGTLMGFFAGYFSFMVWTFMPPNPLLAFTFTPFYSLPLDMADRHEFVGNFGSVLICFVPRILVGTVTGVVLHLMLNRAKSDAAEKTAEKVKTAATKAEKSKAAKSNTVTPKAVIACYVISAAAGSLVNTFGVLCGTWFFFGEQVAEVAGEAAAFLVGTLILTNGIPEAAISAIVCPMAGIPIRKVYQTKT